MAVLYIRNSSGECEGGQSLNGKTAYQAAKEGGYTGTESEFNTKLAQEIPTALPNPQPITINGQRYDGSEAVEVNVAAEGGGATVELDTTLTQSGKAADAKVVGDKLTELNEANAAQNTEIAKKANDAELAKVAKSGSYTDLTNKPTIPTVPSTLPNPNALTFTGAVNETYDGSTAKSVAIPTVPESLKNPNKLTFTGAVTAEYDGSTAVEVTIPEGGSGSDTLPIASPSTLGGVKPVAKTDEMTQAVGVDKAGGLWAMPVGIYPVIAMTADTADLAPNTFYKWGEIAALTITLGAETDGITNEYCFEFVSGDTATTLTVPDTIRWVQEPTIEARKTYQVSILNQIGVIVGA